MRRRVVPLVGAVLVFLLIGCPAPRDVLLVTIPQGDQVLTLGQSVVLTADVVTREGVPTTVRWASDDVSVATVTSSGLLQAVGLGSTFVTATSLADASMSAEVSVTVRSASTWLLDVSRSGQGSGSVRSVPVGIDCGGVCSAEFLEGVSVTLTAEPLAGSLFGGWSGACSGSSATCTLRMAHAQSVTATFDAAPTQQRILVVSRSGSGSGWVTSEPLGIDCGSSCIHDFSDAIQVKLTAVPASGSEFAGWSGCDNTTGAQCTVSMTGLRSVTATFNVPPPPNRKTLSVSRLGSGSGMVTSNPVGVACGSACSALFDVGTSVTLSASASTDSVFVGWGGACSGTGPCTVTMTEARNVTATFEARLHILSVSRSGTGSGSVASNPAGISCGSTCSAQFAHGTSVNLTPTPTSSSAFAGWSGECSGTGTCTVSMTQARSVTATFTAVPSGPSNDDFASPAVISGVSGSTLGSNVGATQEMGEPSHCGFPGGASVWWRWTAPESGQVTITTVGSSFDVLLGVYTGTSVGGLQVVACDGATIGPNNSVTFTATAGTIYRIAVEGYEGVTGDIVLNWSLGAVPTPGPWTLSVSRAGTGSGTVTSVPSGIDCGSDCSESYADGTPVTLTASPSSGSSFGDWSGCQSVSGNQCTVTMTQARSVTATFNLLTQSQSMTISVSGLPSGLAANAVLIEPSGSTRSITATTTIAGTAGTYRLLAGTVVNSTASTAYAPSSLDQSASVPAGGSGSIALSYASMPSRVVAPASTTCGTSTAVGQACVVTVALASNSSSWNGVQIGLTNASFAYQGHTLGSALSGRGCYATGSDSGVGAICASTFTSGTLFEIEYRRVAAGASRFAAGAVTLSTFGGVEATPSTGSLVVR